MGATAGLDAPAVAAAVVGAIQAQRFAQEGERRDDPRRAARRRLAEQQRVAAVARGAQAPLAGQEQAAVDARRLGPLADELRAQELRVFVLVPDRPHRDPVAEAPADRGGERLELPGARARQVVALPLRGPA